MVCVGTHQWEHSDKTQIHEPSLLYLCICRFLSITLVQWSSICSIGSFVTVLVQFVKCISQCDYQHVTSAQWMIYSHGRAKFPEYILIHSQLLDAITLNVVFNLSRQTGIDDLKSKKVYSFTNTLCRDSWGVANAPSPVFCFSSPSRKRNVCAFNLSKSLILLLPFHALPQPLFPKVRILPKKDQTDSITLTLNIDYVSCCVTSPWYSQINFLS